MGVRRNNRPHLQEAHMKSTHNTILTYVKGTALVVTMAAGTAVLMVFIAGADQPFNNYSEQRLEQSARSLPDPLVRLDARQTDYR